jgi:hypothetical protein
LLIAATVPHNSRKCCNAAGFLEPNFGSVLDFAVPGREQISLGRLYYTFKPIEDLSVTIGPQMVAPDFVDKNRYANASFHDFSTAAITNNFILLARPGGAGAAILLSERLRQRLETQTKSILCARRLYCQ